MKDRISPSALSLTLLLSGAVDVQHGESSRSPWLPARSVDRKDRFITAFNWDVERSKDFDWPFASMQPAPYESVRVVIESMPWTFDEKNKTKKSQPMIASQLLKINGRLLKPIRSVAGQIGSRLGEQQEFLAKLNQGRLRLNLVIPPGRVLDPEHRVIRVKLYES